MPAENHFRGRKLIIATRHQKELVIAPVIVSKFKISCFTPNDFDSDQFGTFSGEIERLNSPLETARMKCRHAMEQYGYDLALASEGSFGPHPEIGFIPVDEELLLLMDQSLQREFFVRHLSTNTNFRAAEVRTEQELLEFAVAANFPSHGLILRGGNSTTSKLTKGIIDPKHLRKTFHELLSHFGAVSVETDMRALYNPTRMQVIKEAVEKLILKLDNNCPQCCAIGFSAVSAESGLPCAQCGLPTRSTRLLLYRCECCLWEEEKLFPNGKEREDPGYCDNCNP